MIPTRTSQIISSLPPEHSISKIREVINEQKDGKQLFCGLVEGMTFSLSIRTYYKNEQQDTEDNTLKGEVHPHANGSMIALRMPMSKTAFVVLSIWSAIQAAMILAIALFKGLQHPVLVSVILGITIVPLLIWRSVINKLNSDFKMTVDILRRHLESAGLAA